MARRPGARRVEEFVLFGVLSENGTQNSNRRMPASVLEGDDAARPCIEEQDRKIAEMSGKPPGPIKSATRASRR